MSARKRLSWKPVRRGGIYCSPACGNNCSREAYDTACARAKALAKQLGRGWKAHVWENLGWHWRVVAPAAHLTVRDKSRYQPCACYEAEYCWNGMQRFATARTPAAALKKLVTATRIDLEAMLQAFEPAMKAVVRAKSRKEKP